MSSFITTASYKKEFKERVKGDPRGVWVESHSLSDPFRGTVEQAMLTRAEITVTNRKRSWFAKVERKPDGTLKVS